MVDIEAYLKEAIDVAQNPLVLGVVRSLDLMVKKFKAVYSRLMSAKVAMGLNNKPIVAVPESLLQRLKGNFTRMNEILVSSHEKLSGNQVLLPTRFGTRGKTRT
jgi:hypothetical protein